MTIAELIIKLQELDQDAVIMVFNEDEEAPEQAETILVGPWINTLHGFGGKTITGKGLSANEVMLI